MVQVVHKLIAKTAKSMAGEIYEALAHNDNFYKKYPNVDRFIAKHWRDYIGYTRNAFAQMLANPKYDEAAKAEIYEAMLLDGGFKSPAPLDLRKLRADAGLDPSGVEKRRVLYSGSTLN